MTSMPQPAPSDPIDTEIERVLADNPGLFEELREVDRRFAVGEASADDFLTTAEVRRRLSLRAVDMEREDGGSADEPQLLE